MLTFDRRVNVSGNASSEEYPGKMSVPAATRRLSHVVERSANSAAVRNPSRYYLAIDVSSRFGVRLRQLRRERNLTQARMAMKFGIDRTFISDVERGRKSISLPMLEVLALGFNMTLSELFKDI